jgi:hypothetical protein
VNDRLEQYRAVEAGGDGAHGRSIYCLGVTRLRRVTSLGPVATGIHAGRRYGQTRLTASSLAWSGASVLA